MTGPGAVTGGTWTLRSMTFAGSLVSIAEPARFTASFGDDGRISVKADCNSCGGSYTASGQALEVGALACTKVACSSAPTDTRFVTLLQGSSTFVAESNALVVTSGRGQLRFGR